jgi:hypothetical protein
MQKPGGIIALLDEAWYGLWYFERFVYIKKILEKSFEKHVVFS